MYPSEERDSALAPYRVLDLADEKGLMCGKVLADLGADVIKIELPGGDLARRRGPFYHDEPHPEKSLYWAFCNANKRGITLNLESADGRELFKRLAAGADFLVESFDPGYLSSLGLGYEDLRAINPRLVMTSITPFGQDGPYANYRATDSIAWAMGGELYLTGDEDRPPVQISFPQAYFHAGVEAATGSLMAHYHRELTGEGQHVDVSIQQCVIWTTMDATAHWALNRVNRTRGGSIIAGPRAAMRRLWPCKDGHVVFIIQAGSPSRAAAMKEMVAWMDEDGMAPDYLKAMNWMDDFDRTKVTQEDVDRVEGPLASFFLTKTKAELYEASITKRLMMAPVATAKDIAESPQLAAREYLVPVEHPELGEALIYPGPFLKMSETPVVIRRRAPLIGEHNLEVYCGEMEVPRERVVVLKQAGVI